MSQTSQKYSSLKEFYSFYAGEHRNPVCRLLHVIGTSLSLMLLVYALISKNYLYLWFVPVVGYGFAWTGHFLFEKNRPATFKYPFLSFISDFVLLFNVLTRKERIRQKR